MPPIRPHTPRSCVEILTHHGDKPRWDDYLARLAAVAAEETEAAVEAPAEERATIEALEAKEIADLRRRLGLD